MSDIFPYIISAANIASFMIVFTVGFFILTLLLFHVVRLTLNKYGDMKKRVWVVRRWAEQESEIERLKEEVEKLKSTGFCQK